MKMNPIRPTAFLSAVVAAAAFTGCFSDNPSDVPAHPGEATLITPYKVEGNTIIMEATTYTGTFCDEDSLRKDTTWFKSDTLAFRIAGSTLTVFTDRLTLGSGTVIERVAVFTREGSGTGLQGLWLNTNQERRVVSGVPNAEETDFLEGDKKSMAKHFAYLRSWVRFTEREIFSYEEREYAKRFLSDWNGEFAGPPFADSTRYAITVNVLDKNTVELIGRESGETVRVTQNAEGTTYSSDTPGRAPHHYFNDPKSCPNVDYPDWYFQFRQANRRPTFSETGFGLEKRAEIHPKSVNPRLFPFGPLKTTYSLLN